jgi:hypothetical protein
MSVVNAVSSGLHAAFLLARGRSEGMRYVQSDVDSVQRSFWAMAVSAPAIICLQLIVWLQDTVPANAGHVLALDMMSYVVGWLGFVVLSFYIVPIFNAGPQWGRFIVTWNWCNVVENMLLVVGCIPGLLHAPPAIDEASQIITTGWALWIEWYAARVALSVSGLAAAALVILDQLIGLLLAGLNATLLAH